jgi:LPS-assembly lipoprotein
MRLFLLSAFLISLLVSGCGFQPLYSQTNTLAGNASVLDHVWIEQIPDADGLELRNALIDRFYHHGSPNDPRYILKVRLILSTRDLAIRKNDTTTRAQLVFRADYQLVDTETRQIIDSGNTRAIGSYNILSSQYTTLVTQNAARVQALQELADKLTLRLGIVLTR